MMNDVVRLSDVVRSMRPHQWVKNVFVLAPLVFAEGAEDTDAVLIAGLAFALFSMLSSCTYLLNDIVDVDSDRLHPVKKNRPIASGRLSLMHARLVLAGLLLITVGTSFALSLEFAAIGLGYFCLNVGYSFALKQIPFVDVLSIASGFILRIYGGALAIHVPVSVWLVLCTFFLASFLGLGKRKHELVLLSDHEHQQRPVLQRYNLQQLRLSMMILGVLTVIAYASYIQWGGTLSSFSPKELAWTMPCVLIGLWRFNLLTRRADQGKSPTDLMLSDALFVLNLFVWAAIVFWVIYLR